MVDSAAKNRGHVLVWAEMPYPPLDRPPRNPALAIARWQEAVRSLPPVELPAARMPPLPILSLDPTDRLERALCEAGTALSVVRTRQDMPVRDRPSLLQLGGDLAARAGLLLSWDDVRAAREDADVAYLLDEARRAAQGGTALVWAPNPDDAFVRLWDILLEPTLRGAACFLAFGPADFHWPKPLQHESQSLQEVLDDLVAAPPGSAAAAPAPGAGGHVFISYSHGDGEYARRLQAALQERSFAVWIDDRIDYGTRWPQVIEESLDACAALILLMSPRARGSNWVQNELARAQAKGKPIFPLLLEGDNWLAVQATQYADGRGGHLPPEGFYRRLARVIGQGAVSVPPLAERAPAVEPNPSPEGPSSRSSDL